MIARKLMRWWDGSPAQPVTDFSSIEARLGFALPEDFKDILRVFGLGGFGELHLFHPGSRVGMLRLPEATTDAHALFQRVREFLDESFPSSPSAECAILGMLLPRTYLIWEQANGWRLFDSEMSRSTSVGDDLRSGLDRLFREWLAHDSADKSRQSQRPSGANFPEIKIGSSRPRGIAPSVMASEAILNADRL